MASSHPCCYYNNRSQRLVLLRCIGPGAHLQEKVLFPFEDWLFACPNGSDVQIWSHGAQGVELLDSFPAADHIVAELCADDPTNTSSAAEPVPQEVSIDPRPLNRVA